MITSVYSYTMLYRDLEDSEVLILTDPHDMGPSFIIKATGKKLIRVDWTNPQGKSMTARLEPGEHVVVKTISGDREFTAPFVTELNNGLA